MSGRGSEALGAAESLLPAGVPRAWGDAQLNATKPTPWPSDTLAPMLEEELPDDALTETAGLARNADALGPYAGSF
ncbi:hypothetical protein MON38_14540 [Hymenobacter sp. DH14]|uniref:Uncharacterized protein n=1 Tax=Hymenobacter cyanobacteriorum TaxID=2926463 RepID=A0A9X1VI02_9BACT|nr:hypothetical protein [Hymenobacter cyanobacteriorum]MCI1188642.1 hypothetical protein [Hymenobacter cyanobacteriorum]